MEKNNIKTELEEKSNKQLIEILFFEKSNSNYASIQEIKRILEERGLDKKNIQKIKRKLEIEGELHI